MDAAGSLAGWKAGLGSLLPSRLSGLQLCIFTSSSRSLSWLGRLVCSFPTWCPSDKPRPVSAPEVRVVAPQTPFLQFSVNPTLLLRPPILERQCFRLSLYDA